LRAALGDATARLASSRAYHEVVEAKARVADAPDVTIRLRRAKEFNGDLKMNLESVRKAVVLVTANRGFGSGFVLSEDGKVLTVEHVVSGSKYVKVSLSGGKECYGEVVATSKARDLAVIRTDCVELTPLPLARHPVIEGSEVFAVGSPLSPELQFSVTRGVVSGLRRFEELDYIQSDASVLPGSSGGPLLDASGNAIAVTSGGVAVKSIPVGVNFFVPLADIERFLPIQFE
jgi:serine protease Do